MPFAVILALFRNRLHTSIAALKKGKLSNRMLKPVTSPIQPFKKARAWLDKRYEWFATYYAGELWFLSADATMFKA
jgi:hypothetical protein